MKCADVRAELALQRQANPEAAPALATHLGECAACRRFAAENHALDHLLALDADTTPGPGFDTRFKARLAELDTPPGRLHWSFKVVLAGAVAALGLAAIVATLKPTSGNPEEIELAMNLELAEELELVRNLEVVEAFEVLAQLDVSELDGLGAAAGEKP